MGIEEVRAQVHDVETKGVYWGSGNTLSQKQEGSGNQEIINESTDGHRQKRSQREHRLGGQYREIQSYINDND